MLLIFAIDMTIVKVLLIKKLSMINKQNKLTAIKDIETISVKSQELSNDDLKKVSGDICNEDQYFEIEKEVLNIVSKHFGLNNQLIKPCSILKTIVD